MFWRKFKLDWHYAIGELAIVTLGVLIALGIQQWNEDRLERQEEIEILDRLLFDMATDLAQLQDQFDAITLKEESLGRLEVIFGSGAPPHDPVQFLEDIVIGANYGWNQTTPRSSTFDEIGFSGKFGLIRATELRGAISDYYGWYNSLVIRADARETPYPHISYQLIPRSVETDNAGALRDAELAGVQEETVEKFVNDVLESQIRDYVVAERNLARFMIRLSADILERNRVLVSQIQAYRDSLAK